MKEIIRSTLEAAKAVIQQDRTALADTGMRPDNTMDTDCAAGVAEYDEVLARIDDCLSRMPTKGKEFDALAIAHQLEERFGNTVPTKQAAAALRELVSAVDAEMSPSWQCVSYHPRLVKAVEAARTALAAQPADASSPLLVRDVAELIGSTVPDVCKALVQLGHGQRSTNAAVHPEEAIAAAKLLAQPAEGGGVVTVIGKLGDICSFRSASVRKGDKLYTTPPASPEWRDTLTVNLLRHASGMTKTQIRELIDAAVAGRSPDESMFTPASHMPAEGGEVDVDAICYLATEIRFAKTDDAAQAVIDKIRAMLTTPPASPVVAEGGEVFDWPDRAVLSVMNQVGDGPYGEEDVKVTRHLLKIADEVRAEFTQPASQEQASMPDDWFAGMSDSYRAEAWRIKSASHSQAQQPEPIQTVPSFAQLKQILDNLDRCHTRDSKAEFLRTWIRDWTQHKTEQAQQPSGEVAKAWNEGYRQGIADERTSAANIGIAGFGAKVEPNRQNPYPILATTKQEPMTEHQRGNLVMDHLGPHALTGGKMSILEAFTLGIEATERHYGITKGEA